MAARAPPPHAAGRAAPGTAAAVTTCAGWDVPVGCGTADVGVPAHWVPVIAAEEALVVESSEADEVLKPASLEEALSGMSTPTSPQYCLAKAMVASEWEVSDYCSISSA